MSLSIYAQQRLKAATKKAKREAKRARIGTKKVTLTRAKAIFWALLSRAIRDEYGPSCYTCDREGIQAGHMFPKSRAHALSAWHPDNIRPQCYNCNINLGGNGAEFAARYIAQYGQAQYDHMRRLSREPRKWTVPDIQQLTDMLRSFGLTGFRAFYCANYSDAYE